MQKSIALATLLLASLAVAQTSNRRPAARDQELKKKEVTAGPDISLVGEPTRKKTTPEGPSFTVEQYRATIELQVAEKRREQIRDLQKIIELSSDSRDRANLLFQLGELYWEESRYYFLEANRKDDDKIRALKANDQAGVRAADDAKERLLQTQRNYAGQAVEQYLKVIREYPKYARTDEVLYFLATNLLDLGDERRGIAAFKRLIDQYTTSKYLADAYLALGEYYFNNSRGNREDLNIALTNYKNAAKYPENQIYAYALYKQGWCYYNLNDFEKAMELFRTVVLQAQLSGADSVEGSQGKKGNRIGLAREARNDYVRAYSRSGGLAQNARERFTRLSANPDDLRQMMKQLANLYFDDGKDREAALTYLGLINERPLSPEAPGFQSRIVDSVMRAGKKDATVNQVKRLVAIMTDVLKANPKPNEKDKQLLDEAQSLAERSISRLAVDWHNEAKKTRDDDAFRYADEMYDVYLTLFPNTPKAYDMRFYWASLLYDNLADYPRAAVHYDQVVNQDIARIQKKQAPGRWLSDAAYASILAWTEVVKKANLPTPQSNDPTKPLPIPRERQGVLTACENYIKWVPNGAKRVEIMYKAAFIFYQYNYFDQAVSLYSEIALKYPDYKDESGTNLGEPAAQTVLDIYNLLKDWPKVSEWAKRFYAEPKLGGPAFKEEMKSLVEQSSFKVINQLEAKGDYRAAGDAYVTFVSEWPRSSLADRAYYNAAIDYFKGGAVQKAIDTQKLLVSKYPNSPHVPGALYALAESYEATGDFDTAADYYETYANNYERTRAPAPAAPVKKQRGRRRPPPRAAKKPDSESTQTWVEDKAHDALFNAAIFREGLGQYKQSLSNRQKYIELWPERKETEAVERSIITMHEKLGAWNKAREALEEYARKYQRDANKVLQAQGRIATIAEEHLRNPRLARLANKNVLDVYEGLSRRAKENLDKPALEAVGWASYASNDEDWRRFNSLRLRWNNFQQPGEFRTTVGMKSEALAKVQAAYTKTVAMKASGPAICSLYRIGAAYDQFSNQLTDLPTPRGANEEAMLEVRAELKNQSEPLRVKATEAFTSAVNRSRELDSYNRCTSDSLSKLRTVYAPAKYPTVDDQRLQSVTATTLNPPALAPPGLALAIGRQGEAAAPPGGKP